MIQSCRVVAMAWALAMASPVTAQTPVWKEAAPDRPIVLPADHASHPDYKVEWWYYTGNLDAADGRRFGYQLTFFRVGMDSAPRNPSRWAVRDVFMAHLAITDVGRQRFRFADRINRAGPGWAGASMDTYRVWNEGWEVRREGDGRHRLTASTDAFGIDLDLEEGRAAVRHGEQGYSRKGGAAGNASFYYSLTRMPTRGRLALDGQSIEVSGSSWMDHEFGTTFLEKDQVGWDWFSLQFDDGRDLMVFQLRRRDGSIDPRSSGTLVEPDGRVRHITAGRGLTLQPGRAWTSPTSGARYPVEWRVRVPDASMDVIVTAAVQGQELQTGQSTGVTYWEGAVDAAGTIGGKRVNGRGYLEMTGYAAERGLEALQ